MGHFGYFRRFWQGTLGNLAILVIFGHFGKVGTLERLAILAIFDDFGKVGTLETLVYVDVMRV